MVEALTRDIEYKPVTVIPENTSDTYILMFKPDVYLKPTICNQAVQNILLGLGDVISGGVQTEFYRSSHGARVAQWAIDKWGTLSGLDEMKKVELVMGIESLRAEYSQKQDNINLGNLIYSVLDATQYRIVSEVECTFTEPWIRRLYTYLNYPDPVRGEDSKRQVIDALLKGNLKFLFVRGPAGHEFLDVIKFVFRKTVRDYTRDIVNPSESLMHVPDPGNEKEITFNLLRDYFSELPNP